MTGDRNAFVEETYVTLPANRRHIRTAIGELVSAAGIGTIQPYTWTPEGGHNRLFLTEVLHVPGATEAGLISVSQLTRKGVKIAFTDNLAEFYQDGILIAIAEKWNKLYKLLQSGKYQDFGLHISKKDDTTTALWHHRFAHLHLPAVLKMSNTEVVRGIPCLQANNKANRCPACITGKMTSTPFCGSTHTTKTPLKLVYSDLCGPMQSQSLGFLFVYLIYSLFMVQELACSVSYGINKTVIPCVPLRPKINPSPQVPLVWNQPHISPKRKKQPCLAK